jgi:hypothetical protein
VRRMAPGGGRQVEGSSARQSGPPPTPAVTEGRGGIKTASRPMGISIQSVRWVEPRSRLFLTQGGERAKKEGGARTYFGLK